MVAPYVQYPVPYSDTLDLKNQSVEVPGTKRAGQTGHYRNASHHLVDLASPNTIRNLHEAFENGLAIAGPNARCLGQRKLVSREPLVWGDTFEWQSWATIDARRRSLGSGIYNLFEDGTLKDGDLHTVGLWSKNTANWQLIDLSLSLFNLVSVALYDTLGQDAVEYVVNHAETTIVFASTQNILSLLKISARTPLLKVIVAMEELASSVKSLLLAWGQSVGIRIMELSEVEALGKANIRKPSPPSSETVATICYTSGTTGVPKGAILTQGGLAAGARGNMYGGNFGPERILYISYLPLAHIFERVMQILCITLGGAIGFGTGDPLRLLEDLQLLKPSLLTAVPRVMNRVVAASMAASKAGGLKGALFNRALQTKLANFHRDGTTGHALWDRLVFSKIQAVLGGNVEFVGLGGAPMTASALNFLKIALNCDIVEGLYGSTETCAAGTRGYAPDFTVGGTIGAPALTVELKLVDVPSLGYRSEDKPNPRGEICVRGVPCFKGYLKDEKNTKAALDEEGWYHSGDVGEIDSLGRFKIIDRVKNIMKLSQGEYVAIERIESLYGGAPVAAQLYVHGESTQSYLVAVLIPDPVQLASVSSAAWGTFVSSEDLQKLQKATQDPEVIKKLLAELDKEADKSGLKGFEKIKYMHVTLDPFTVEEGTLTPTLKMRRKDAYSKFKREIDAMYAQSEVSAISEL